MVDNFFLNFFERVLHHPWEISIHKYKQILYYYTSRFKIIVHTCKWKKTWYKYRYICAIDSNNTSMKSTLLSWISALLISILSGPRKKNPENEKWRRSPRISLAFKKLKAVTISDILLRQITTFIKVHVAFVIGLHTL